MYIVVMDDLYSMEMTYKKNSGLSDNLLKGFLDFLYMLRFPI